MSDGFAIQGFYSPLAGDDLPRVARAEGPYLWDEEGRRYIDASSGPIATNLGHGNTHVIETIAEQAARVAFASRMSFVNTANEDLARRLATLSGPGFDRAYFTSGGSEAIEAAIKLARQAAVLRGQAGRWKVISRMPSYHGGTLGALSITGDEETLMVFEPMLTRARFVPAPFTYRIPEGYTPDGWQLAAARRLEDAILREGPDTCLAFILEPVGGLATGALVADDIYMRTVRDICTRHGIFLIYDEVMSGAGRTGKFLAAHHWPDAQPDLVVLAKGIGAGYTPLGVVLTPKDLVAEMADTGGFLHGHTYVANPLTCATGLAVLNEVERLDLIENASVMGAYLDAMLHRLKDNSPIVGDVRGRGLLCTIELVADKKTKRGFALDVCITDRATRIARRHGLILYARRTNGGRDGEWLMIAPPLTITRAQIGEIEVALMRTLTDCVDELHRDGILPVPSPIPAAPAQ